jgi:hypothetical protein
MFPTFTLNNTIFIILLFIIFINWEKFFRHYKIS